MTRPHLARAAVAALGLLVLSAAGCTAGDTPTQTYERPASPNRPLLVPPPPPTSTQPPGAVDPLERPAAAVPAGSAGETARRWAAAVQTAATTVGEPPAALEQLTAPGRLPALLTALTPTPPGQPTLTAERPDPTATGAVVVELTWPAGVVWSLRLTPHPDGGWLIDTVSTDAADAADAAGAAGAAGA